MKRGIVLAALAAASVLAVSTQAQAQVSADWVRAHETFLAGEELRGRGSATPDEAIAAAYVAAQFRGFGLQTAPGMDGYLQKAEIVRLALKAPITLAVDGKPVAGATLLFGDGKSVEGTLMIAPAKALSRTAPADVLLVTGDQSAMQVYRTAAQMKSARVVLVRESAETRAMTERLGGSPRLPSYLRGEDPGARPSLVVLPAGAFDALAKQGGTKAALTVPITESTSVTTNAVGWLPGTDPKAGVLLLSAHLDHLGVLADGTVMHGANDDASGTTAVLELARTLAARGKSKRGILFVAYGAEEIGGFGSTWFGAHPPVPLDQIVANVEVEMIGAQDPKLPAGTMMMTGYERSTLGETLKAHGALVTADPYPEQNFFQRSDNYSLARKGVVAHTISGWAVVPTYHSKDDTVANIDIAFMTRAIQSLVEPLHALANSDAKPEWKPGGKPE
ncbi:M28 family metallopeptidase [Sphingomonas elodea]|uniref:M28 family metallopeptidase n=1 Tax=Sphingomonas elodea TaxID=179878 RepID=UPI0002630B25|nr:M28 family peptidase [Sphingomonas elodea]